MSASLTDPLKSNESVSLVISEVVLNVDLPRKANNSILSPAKKVKKNLIVLVTLKKAWPEDIPTASPFSVTFWCAEKSRSFF